MSKAILFRAPVLSSIIACLALPAVAATNTGLISRLAKAYVDSGETPGIIVARRL